MKKYYFYDLGVRNSLIGNFTDISLRPDKGAMWENFMIMERLKMVSNHQQYGNFYFWRTYSGAEIDLVEERDGILHGYEMKWGSRKRKPPKSWKEAYPQSTFQSVNPENFLDIWN